MKKTSKATPKSSMATGFISFASVTNNIAEESINATSNDTLLPLYTGSDVEFHVTAKKLLKKDQVTRLKALGDLQSILKDRGDKVAQDIIPYFVFVYLRLILENQRNIREQLNQSLLQLVILDKRAFTPYMKHLIGPWWMSASDPASDVARTSQNAFETAIPPKKREQVLQYLSSDLLRYITNNLTSTPDSLSEKGGLSPEELEDRYERVVMSSLASISKLLSILPKESNATIAGRDEGSGETGYRSLVDSLWKHVASSKPTLRRAAFETMAALIRQATGAMSDVADAKVTVVVGFLGEVDPGVLPATLESFIAFVTAFPAIWTPQSLKKFSSKFKELVRRAPAIAMPCLLPVLGSIPSTASGFPSDVASETLTALLQHIASTLHDTSTDAFTAALTVAESSVLLLLRPWATSAAAQQGITSTPLDEAVSCRVQRVCDLLSTAVSAVLRHACLDPVRGGTLARGEGKSSSGSGPNVRREVQRLLAQLHRATTADRNLVAADWETYLWSKLSATIFTSLSEEIVNVGDGRTVASAVSLCSGVLGLVQSAVAETESTARASAGVRGLLWSLVEGLGGNESLATNSASSLDQTIVRYAVAIRALSACPVADLPAFVTPTSLLAMVGCDTWAGGLFCLLRDSPEDSASALGSLYSECLRFVLLHIDSCTTATLARKLFESCASSESLRGVVTLWRSGLCADDVSILLDWAAGVRDSLLGLSTQSVAVQAVRAADAATRLEFMCLSVPVSSQKSQIVARALSAWTSYRGHGVALWMLLTAAADLLAARGASSGDKSALAEIGGSVGLQQLLIVAFTSNSASGHTDGDSSLRTVRCWADAEKYVLSLLPSDDRAAIGTFLAAELRKRVEDAGGDGDDLESEPGVGSGTWTGNRVGPKKWIVSVLKLVNLAERRADDGSLLLGGRTAQQIYQSAGLTDTTLWRSVPTASTAFLYQSLLQLAECDASGRSAVSDVLLSSTELLMAILSRTFESTMRKGDKLASLSTAVRELCLNTVAAASASFDICAKLLNTALWDQATSSTLDRESLYLAARSSLLAVLGLTDSAASGVSLESVLGHQHCLSDRETEALEAERLAFAFMSETTHASTKTVLGSRKFLVCRDPLVGKAGVEVVSVRNCTVTGLESSGKYSVLLVAGQGSPQADQQVVEAFRLLSSLSVPSGHTSDYAEVLQTVCSEPEPGEFSSACACVRMSPVLSAIRTFLTSASGPLFGGDFPQRGTDSIDLLCEAMHACLQSAADRSCRDCAAPQKYLLSACPCARLLATCRGVLCKQLSPEVLSRCPLHQIVALLRLLRCLTVSEPVAGVWLAAVVPCLRSCAEQVRSRVRLVLGPTGGLVVGAELCNVYSGLLTRVSSLTVFEDAVRLLALVHSMLALPGAEAEAENVRLQMSVSRLLAELWRQQNLQFEQLRKDDVNASAAMAATARMSRSEGGWGLTGIRFVVVALLSAHKRSEEVAQSVLSAAVHRSLQGLSRSEGLAFVSSGGLIEFEEPLLAIVAESGLCTTRIAAAKVLDVMYCGPPDLPPETQTPVDADEDEAASMRVLEEVLGKRLSGWLTALCASKKATGEEPLAERGAKKEEGEKEEPEVEDSDEQELVDASDLVPVEGGEGDDALSIVLPWLLCMQRIAALSASNGNIVRRQTCLDCLRAISAIESVLPPLLRIAGDLLSGKDLEGSLLRLHPCLVQSRDVRRLAAYGLFRSVLELPALVRVWWADLPRGNKNSFRKFVEERVGAAVAAREVGATSMGRWEDDTLAVRASALSREIVAVYTHDDAKLELVVRLPPGFPLANADVQCSSRIGFAEGRGDRWRIQIVHRLSSQNGSVVEAIQQWKRSVDQELEGVEPCPICYSTLHPKLLSLPSLACRTCKNKFHNSCLHKWFQTSGKSKCVICQETFFQ